MKYLLYSLLLLSLAGCNTPDPEIVEPPAICTSDSTTLQFSVYDYYSGQPVGGTQLKVLNGYSCDWCPIPDTILTQTANPQGGLWAAFKHSKGVDYNASIVLPDPYLSIGPFPVRSGCVASSKLFLKPKIKLGIWIKNPTNSDIYVSMLSIVQRPDLHSAEVDAYDPAQDAYTSSQTPGWTFPAKSDWKVFWFDALPEEQLEVWLDYGYTPFPQLEVFHTNADSVFNCQIQLKEVF
ncbi:MAG TPA: hypothetical protein PLO67_23675 [Saprospiraceae bacterium]|nr:hypothetical protein [Saprospiraceae bacterium]HPI09325.1 hypothetical protein [Saprospiraceae bacterium]